MGQEGGVTHVRRMVVTVKVLPIPAGLEEGLCSHTIAGLLGEAVGVVAAGCIQAYMLHGLVFKK
jgi:hypothetical protein